MVSRYRLKLAPLPVFFTLMGILLGTALPARSPSPQEGRKRLDALRTSTPPAIDGRLDEAAWSEAQPATDFFQYEPSNNAPASQSTEVKVLYDDHSLYIGARMHDSEPSSILREMGLRDEHNLNADLFWIEINPFDDGIYGYSFKVSASGVQGDSNISLGAGTSQGGDYGRNEDRNWDAVWKSRVRQTADGWEAELAIPYSALRFPRQEQQRWGINFWREIRRTRETSSWNFVDRTLSNKLGSMGILEGISGIKPHTRLAFFPYLSSYLKNGTTDTSWKGSFNGGLDVKYGLNESFTLDTILIPDFGQVESDPAELNLSPYEIKYDEKRQFFTEGTELFNKADLFYSRRVGGRPSGYDGVESQIGENEILLSNPQETRLINAVKFSGRTAKGLGIGIFNALTAETRARVKNVDTGEEREIVTQPFSTYTLLVLDQSLKNNSYISLVNASVLGLREGYTSNVTGLDFRFLDRSRQFRFSGNAALSQQYQRDGDNVFGHKYTLNLGRYAGTWQYAYTRTLVSDRYHQNDLGYLRRNNEVTDTLSLSHNTYEPFGIFNTVTHKLSLTRNGVAQTGQLSSLALGYSVNLLFRDRFMLYTTLTLYPGRQRDFYEPRVPGRYFETHDAYSVDVMFSSNYRNPVYVDGDVHFIKSKAVTGQSSLTLTLTPTFRLSNRIHLSAGLTWGMDRNGVYFVRTTDENQILFGQRNTKTLVPTLKGTVMFNNDLSLSVSVRHYWSRVTYLGNYFLLGNEGGLDPASGVTPEPNINYNSFTLDTQLTWNFAPGSQLSLVWKNAIESMHNQIIPDYFDNARFFFGQPQFNSLSLKILYYLDHRAFSGS